MKKSNRILLYFIVFIIAFFLLVISLRTLNESLESFETLEPFKLEEAASYVQELNPLLPTRPGYNPSSISHLFISGQHWIVIRYVGYTLHDKTYVANPPLPFGSTCSYLVSIEIVDDGIKLIEGTGKWITEPGRKMNEIETLSLEDLRLYPIDTISKVGINGTSYDRTKNNIKYEFFTSKINLETGVLDSMTIFKSDQPEKNWIPINPNQFIYGWKDNMIQWASIHGNDWSLTHSTSHSFPVLNSARGSSCFVDYKDGLIAGIVHSCDESKNYLHYMVVMDPRNDYEVIKCSKSFVYHSP